MGGTWNKMKFTTVSAKLIGCFFNHFLIPVKTIYFTIIDTAHKCDIFSIFFDQFWKIID